MNKFFLKLLLIAVAAVLIVTILNTSVITKQGVNYQVHEIKMPVYLKLLDFIDRHYNYKNLVVNILGDTKNDNLKAIEILGWVKVNLRRNPDELPVIDDHPLNILIRGYGVEDQFEDIFTILCTYAGMRAFYKRFNNSSGERYFISFVKINGKWCPLSAYGGVYAHKNGLIASVDDLVRNRGLLEPFINSVENFEAESFLSEIAGIDFKQTSRRTTGQSPFCRIVNITGEIIKKGH